MLQKFVLPLSLITTCLILSFSQTAFALPVDWHGVLGADSNLIKNYRRTEDKNVVSSNGSQAIAPSTGLKESATFQSYIFRLNPHMIVNDSASIKGEITTGYGRGGFFGQDSINRANNSNGTPNRSFGNALYYYNTSDSNSNVIFNKFYAELYSDIATFVVGRYSPNWGLGAIVNSGEKVWDRHTSVKDGFQVKFKLGNFYITPHYAKINSPTELTKATNVKEIGISLLYDNPERDLAFGVYHAKRTGAPQNSFYQSTTTNTDLGETNIKLTDIYAAKAFGPFSIKAEVPIYSGDMGYVFDSNTVTRYKANAFIFETKFDISEKFNLGLNFGHVSGADGATARFSAMYLNPNYQIAHLLFNYNLLAVNDQNQNIFDSYVHNTQYAKLYANYFNNNWTWGLGLVYAKANETAKVGNSFNHTKNIRFSSNYTQSDELGYEIDFDVNYAWNDNVNLGVDLGYFFVGDYYAYTNTGNKLQLENSYVGVFKVAVDF